MSEEKFEMSEAMNPRQWGNPEDWQEVEMPSPEIAKEVAKRWNAYDGLKRKIIEQQNENQTLVDEVERLRGENKTQKLNIEAFEKLTESWDEHPEDYEGPCFCALCRSYV